MLIYSALQIYGGGIFVYSFKKVCFLAKKNLNLWAVMCILWVRDDKLSWLKRRFWLD